MRKTVGTTCFLVLFPTAKRQKTARKGHQNLNNGLICEKNRIFNRKHFRKIKIAKSKITKQRHHQNINIILQYKQIYQQNIIKTPFYIKTQLKPF